LATDIVSGEEVVIKEGPVVPAVRASASIPVIFTPAKWQGRYLVDGVLTQPVPVRVLRDMGADIIIAVNVLPLPGIKREPGEKRRRLPPTLISVVTRMIYILGYQAAQGDLKEADIVITPKVGHIFPASFHRSRECITEGERAAQLAIPEIKKILES
jgi:NTE family protein